MKVFTARVSLLRRTGWCFGPFFECLAAQPNFVVLVDLQNFDLDRLTDLEHVLDASYSMVSNLGNMEEPDNIG